MLEKDISLRDYFHAIRRRRWMIIIIFLLTVASITIKSFRQPSVYQATARLLLEKEAPNVLSFREVLAQDTATMDYYQTQYKLLKSPALAKQVLQKLGRLDQARQEQSQTKPPSSEAARATATETKPPSSEAVKATKTERQIIGKFLNKVTISPVRGSRLVDVSVKSTDPEQAALFANTLVEVYIGQDLKTKLSASKDAVNWLEKQLEVAREKVTESEAVLQEYKEKHAIISFQDRQNIILQKLSQLNRAVNEVKIKRTAIEAEYKRIQQYTPAQLESVSQVISSPLIRQLKIDLSDLESELSELQKRFRGKHPSVIALQSQITSVQDRIDAEIKRIITSIKSEYEVAWAQERELTKMLEQQKREALELNRKTAMYEELQREVESNRRIYDVLLQRVKETSITEQLETSNIRIVERATVPDYPIAPNKKRNILIAMIIGLFMGTVLAIFFESLDTSIKTPEDIKRYLDIPFLGIIPKVSTKDIVPDEEKPAMDVIVATIVIVAPKAIVSEAYRSLRTNVGRVSSHEQGLVLLVTSAVAGEGKSGIVANLGIALAQSGRKTLIIDSDLRKPAMHQIFHLKNTEPGFVDMIKNGGINGTKIAIRRTDIQNLDVIPCGEIPPNPSEILESELTKTTIETLGKEYDMIIVDSPPVNAVTDPVILSRIANEVILTIRARETKREAAQCAREQLRDAGATILGGVLNNVDIKKDSYYYGYHYTHSHYYREKDKTNE